MFRCKGFRARLALSTGIIATLAAVSGTASAQNAPDPVQQDAPPATQPVQTEAGSAASAPSGGLEDIVVTAERRSQRLQDVPISATVITSNEISRRGVASAADLQRIAPSLAINTNNRSTYINIRGVGLAQTAPTSVPGVAFYVDGVLIPNDQLISQSFFDIASIEVLRGPQGTLSGQNSTGGAIYVRSPAPVFADTFGSIDLTGGNFGHGRAVAAINLAGGGNYALRVAYVHDQRKSYTDNIGPSASTPGNNNMDAIRANLAVKSSDDRFNLNLRGEYFNSRSDNIAIKRPGDTVSTDPFVIEEDARGFLNQKGYRVSGEASYDVTDSVRVRGLTSWQDADVNDQADGDRSATALPRPPVTNIGRVSLTHTGLRTLTNEINILSTGSGQFQWVVGGFTLDSKIPSTVSLDNAHTTDFLTGVPAIDIFAKNRSRSLFGQATLRFAEQFELLAGARQSWDRQILTRYTIPGPPLAAPFTSQTKSSEATGKVAINYHPSPNSLIYLSASKGYKAGGVNVTPSSPNYDPEKNFVYEAGVKTFIIPRILRINADLFYSNYKNIQLQGTVAGIPATQNAASGHAKGGEVEISGQFDHLNMTIGAGYLDAKLASDACVSDAFAPGTGVGCPANTRLSAEGTRLPFSPKLTLNAGVQYDFALDGDFTLTPRIQLAHLSTQYVTPFPSIISKIPERTVFDARLTLANARKWQVEAFVDNFTDKTYIASQISNATSSNGGTIYGAPRTFGIRLLVNVGNN